MTSYHIHYHYIGGVEMGKLKISDLLLDPSVSFWLKDAIRQLEKRDPVDAANDARLLARVFEQRVEEVLKAHGGRP